MLTEEVTKVIHSWGWTSPPKVITDLAIECWSLPQILSGQYLVQKGFCTEKQLEKWLQSKPADIPTLTWLSEQDSGLKKHLDRYLTLRAGYPFYQNLSALCHVHPCMSDAAVVNQLDELDAAVFIIEDTTPILAFSGFAALLRHSTLGRQERSNSAIQKAIGADYKLAVAPRGEITRVLNLMRTGDDSRGSVSANMWIAEAAENQNNPANREVGRLIYHALSIGATDIALMPNRGGEYQVRLRKNGELIAPHAVADSFTADLSRQILALLQAKSGANPDGTVKRLPTGGQITFKSALQDAYLRISFLPLNHLGDLSALTSISIRLLPHDDSPITLKARRVDATAIEALEFFMRLSQGLVLVVGPTNSGKSTTIAGALTAHAELWGDRKKRLSIEDPIERFIDCVQQYNAPGFVKNEAERFQILLREFKRHDPDVIWVGEVRDRVTAALCVESAASGHLVLSTLHANDAVTAFDSLAQSIDQDRRYQLIESLGLIVSQRLLGELCPHCREVCETTSAEKDQFAAYCELVGEEHKLPHELAHRRLEGCQHCDGGLIGMVPINDVLRFTRGTKDAAHDVLKGANRKELGQHRTLTLLQSGLRLLSTHRVSLDEVMV